MVNHRKQDTLRKPAKQGVRDVIPEPNQISASTPYDFRGKNLTPYGGLLPVATLLEKLGFQSLLEETLTVKRATKVMGMYQFFLGIVLGIYVGFSRLRARRWRSICAGRGRHLAAHHTGHGAVAVSVRGGEDRESCRAKRCELQRSLRRKGAVRKADGSVARHHAAGSQLRARAGGGTDIDSARDADEPDTLPVSLTPSGAPESAPAEIRRGVRPKAAPQVATCRARA